MFMGWGCDLEGICIKHVIMAGLVNGQGRVMRKGYIMKWTRRPEPESHLDDFQFCEFAQDAAFYTDQQLAQNDCTMLNRGITVTVPSAQEGVYTIRNFAVEEREPGIWVIYCHAPF
jgi:hypothetical protein